MFHWLEIEGDGCSISIEPRPPHCNRGRVYAKVHGHDPIKVAISEADPWPRYYFYVEHAVLECLEWLRSHGAITNPEDAPVSLWTMQDGKPVRISEVASQSVSMAVFREGARI